MVHLNIFYYFWKTKEKNLWIAYAFNGFVKITKNNVFGDFKDTSNILYLLHFILT